MDTAFLATYFVNLLQSFLPGDPARNKKSYFRLKMLNCCLELRSNVVILPWMLHELTLELSVRSAHASAKGKSPPWGHRQL